MTYEFLAALLAFALVSSITPGPNNLMLMASGANFGFKSTIPHMLGVGIGFVILVICVGLGLMQVFDAYPVSYEILKVFSVCYLLYLSYKIATAAAPQGTDSGKGKPFTFIQAALFQWVNPKAWTMALTAITVYSPSRSFEAILIVAAAFGMVNLPAVSAWAVLGQQMQNFLNSSRRLRVFNYGMASLLIASLYPVLNP